MKHFIVGWAYITFAGIVAILGGPKIFVLFFLLMAQLVSIELAILAQTDALKRKDGETKF